METKPARAFVKGLVITIEGQAEARFTAAGQRMVVFRAVGIGNMRFEMWDWEDDDRIELMNTIIELPPNSTVVVDGTAEKVTINTDPRPMYYVRFTVNHCVIQKG